MTSPDLFHIPLAVFIGTFVVYWFHSSLPVTVTKIIRWLGFRKHDNTYWPEPDTYDFWVRPQWAAWISNQMAFAPKPAAWGIQLITCPYCVAFHMTWIAAVGVGVFAGPAQLPWCATYPAIALFMKRYLS